MKDLIIKILVTTVTIAIILLISRSMFNWIYNADIPLWLKWVLLRQ